MSKLAVTSGIVGLWLSSFTILSAQTLSVTEYPASSGAGAIVTGPDGALWFTEGAKIGRITTAGSLTEYPIPPDSSGSILSITSGPEGALWYVETFNNKIARITTAGVVTEYAIPTSDTNPWGIASGPDGAVWFTEQYGNNIGRITTAGVITEYPIPTSNAQPGGIVAGPDGALWFTETIGDKIGRITTSGFITEYPIPTATSQPSAITVGSDGALWFVESFANKIGRVTTSGVITEYTVPAPAGQLGPIFSPVTQTITTGPDGAIWFTEPYAKQVGRITTAGALTQYQLSPAGGADGITLGPDGALWIGITGGIGRVTPLAGAPSILTGGIVNAASYAAVNGLGSPVAPGSLVAIFTSTLAASAASFTTASLPNSLGGVSLTFNGVTAPIVQVAPTFAYPYVSAQVPFEVLGSGQTTGTVPAVITVNNIPSTAVQTSIVSSAPGIFTIPPTGQGNAILVFINSATNAATIAAPASASLGYPAAPIPRGTLGFFYVTGLGAMTPPVADGSGNCPAANGCNANAMPTVLIGGISASVIFAGQAPGYPGVFQVNITIPQNTPTGNSVPLVVQSADGSVTSNAATIAVQ